MFGQETDDLYIRSMFGCNARRVPMWMKVQANPDGTTMFVVLPCAEMLLHMVRP